MAHGRVGKVRRPVPGEFKYSHHQLDEAFPAPAAFPCVGREGEVRGLFYHLFDFALRLNDREVLQFGEGADPLISEVKGKLSGFVIGSHACPPISGIAC